MNGNFDDYTGPLDGGSGMYGKVMRSNPVMFPPYFPVSKTVNPEYLYVQHVMFGNAGDGHFINPYADMVKGYKDYSRSRMSAQFEVNQDLNFLTQGLKLRVMLNTNRYSFFQIARAYRPYFYGVSTYNQLENTYTIDPISNGEESIGIAGGGSEDINSDFYMESMVNYDRTFAEKHSLSGLLVFQMRSAIDARINSLIGSLPYRNMGLSGRATYSYDRRYATEFNFGYNGSERFDKNHRYGFFPSVGAAWNVSNEEFWDSLKPSISKLKLRASYGVVGNDAIGSDRFFYLSNVNVNQGSRGASFGYEENAWGRNGVEVSQYPNPAITWEKAYKSNIALEVGLFKQLNIIAEYFHEHRKDILMTRASIPNTMGLQTNISANVGEAATRGVDLSADYSKAWNNGAWLTARANFTYATNKFLKYEEPEYAEYWRSREGYSIQQQWGYIAERLFIDKADVANSPKQPFGFYGAGDMKFLDVNNDGEITQADKVPIGKPTTPEIVYGFGASFGYKGFDISAFFQGLDNRSFWINPSATAPFVGEKQVLKAYADSYWSESDRDIYALWPRLSNSSSNNNTQQSTWFMRDGAFIRLKQLELGYSLPQSILDKIKLNQCRFYVSANNLFTLSKFKMWDVEMGGNGLGYPIQQSINLGINIIYR